MLPEEGNGSVYNPEANNMMAKLLGHTFIPLAAINTSFLRQLTVGLSVAGFVLGFVLWFLRYVRIDKSESQESEA
jgi:hypothetical protein